MSSKRNLRVIRFLTLGLLAAVLCVGVANAAPPFEGKFILPYEVRWGKAMLPAGDYSLRLEYINAATIVTIQESKSRKMVAFVLSPIAESNPEGESALLIADRGRQRVVHSLRLAELGVVLIYEPALARGWEVQEARKTQAVPVLAAKK